MTQSKKKLLEEHVLYVCEVFLFFLNDMIH